MKPQKIHKKIVFSRILSNGKSDYQQSSLKSSYPWQLLLGIDVDSFKEYKIVNNKCAWIVPKPDYTYTIEANYNADYNNYQLQKVTVDCFDKSKIKPDHTDKAIDSQLFRYLQQSKAVAQTRIEILKDFVEKNIYKKEGNSPIKSYTFVSALLYEFNEIVLLLANVVNIGQTTIDYLKGIVHGQESVSDLQSYLETRNIRISQQQLKELIQLSGNASNTIQILDEEPFLYINQFNPQNELIEEDGKSILTLKQLDQIYIYNAKMNYQLKHQRDLITDAGAYQRVRLQKDRIQAILHEVFYAHYEKEKASYIEKQTFYNLFQQDIWQQYTQLAAPIIDHSNESEEMHVFATVIDAINMDKEQSISQIETVINGVEKEVYTFNQIFQTEKDLVKRIKKISDTNKTFTGKQIPKNEITMFIKELENNQLHFRYTEEQKAIIEAAIQHKFVIITGNAGTGKSTIVQAIATILSQKGKVHFCAPTGKAADNLKTILDHKFNVQTIHSKILDYFLDKKQDLDVLIIDELSMVNLTLLNNLLKHVEEKTQIILLGDDGQLEAVTGISSLPQLMQLANKTPNIYAAHLTKVLRQAEDSPILTHANLIKAKQLPTDLQALMNQSTTTPTLYYQPLGKNDLTYIFAETPNDYRYYNVINQEININELSKNAIDYYQMYLQANGQNQETMKKIQIIAPTLAMCRNVNQVLQSTLNGKTTPDQRLIFRPISKNQTQSIILQVGDRIINKRNKEIALDTRIHNDGKQTTTITNGMLGFIREIQEDKTNSQQTKISVTFDNGVTVLLTTEDLIDIELGYAITVHKSQGSTIENVIFISEPIPHFITSNLVYTAFTRAKHHLIVIGKLAGLSDYLRSPLPQKSLLETIYLKE